MGLASIHRINEFHATIERISVTGHDSGTRCRPVLLQISSITFCKFRSLPQNAERCARTARKPGQPPTAIDRLG